MRREDEMKHAQRMKLPMSIYSNDSILGSIQHPCPFVL